MMGNSHKVELMRRAIDLSAASNKADGDRPFGAIVVKDGEIVGEGRNCAGSTCDATAHSEVVAIRDAGARLGTADLSGCEMYTSCEPCPMCAAAIHWARLDEVLFGATIDDAAEAGFNELDLTCSQLYDLGGSGVETRRGVLKSECKALFQLWKEGPNPIPN